MVSCSPDLLVTEWTEFSTLTAWCIKQLYRLCYLLPEDWRGCVRYGWGHSQCCWLCGLSGCCRGPGSRGVRHQPSGSQSDLFCLHLGKDWYLCTTWSVWSSLLMLGLTPVVSSAHWTVFGTVSWCTVMGQQSEVLRLSRSTFLISCWGMMALNTELKSTILSAITYAGFTLGGGIIMFQFTYGHMTYYFKTWKKVHLSISSFKPASTFSLFNRDYSLSLNFPQMLWVV